MNVLYKRVGKFMPIYNKLLIYEQAFGIIPIETY